MNFYEYTLINLNKSGLAMNCRLSQLFVVFLTDFLSYQIQ